MRVPIPVVVAIDGPSGSGKSSASKGVARRFAMAYLDTGAMYRALTWQVLRDGVDPGDPDAVAELAARAELTCVPDPDDSRIYVGARDVTEAIRSPRVTAAVSAVSGVPAVRERLVGLQREVAARARETGRGIVVEGRDIGTVVLPDAALKIFLTADPAARAERRAAEDSARGQGGDVGETALSIRRRDHADSARAVSPLAMADDAIEVDATYLTLPEVIAVVGDLVEAVAGGSVRPGTRAEPEGIR